MGKSQTDPTQKHNQTDWCRAGVSACCPRLCCPMDFGRPMLILRNSNFPNLGLKSGAWKFEKNSFHAILVRIWRRVALWWRVPKLWKNIEFSRFSHQNIWFYLGKIDVCDFWRLFGTLDDHINFEQPKKTSKNLEFLNFIFGSRVRGQQSWVRNWVFRLHGKRVFSKT